MVAGSAQFHSVFMDYSVSGAGVWEERSTGQLYFFEHFYISLFIGAEQTASCAGGSYNRGSGSGNFRHLSMAVGRHFQKTCGEKTYGGGNCFSAGGSVSFYYEWSIIGSDCGTAVRRMGCPDSVLAVYCGICFFSLRLCRTETEK